MAVFYKEYIEYLRFAVFLVGDPLNLCKETERNQRRLCFFVQNASVKCI